MPIALCVGRRRFHRWRGRPSSGTRLLRPRNELFTAPASLAERGLPGMHSGIQAWIPRDAPAQKDDRGNDQAADNASSQDGVIRPGDCYRGAGLGHRAAMAGGDRDGDAATCSRGKGDGDDRVKDRRQTATMSSPRLVLAPVVALGAHFGLRHPSPISRRAFLSCLSTVRLRD